MAGLIAPSTLEQIRAANDIVDVIGSYFPLKRAGANFVALCPFHREKSPSFNVNPHRQTFHCFGCHKGGDVFSFVRDYENLTFVDAVRRLADRANITMEFDSDPALKQARHIKDQLLEIHEQITRRWHGALMNEASGKLAREYLEKRGVAEEAMVEFRLGAAPEEWDDTVNWGKGKGYELEILEKAGLVLRKEGSDHYYDRFRGRLIFPIGDEQGRIIGFSGRLLEEQAKAAKYVNSPETPIFRKSKVFFGMDKAKRPILDAEIAIICEGQLDLIACHTAGIRNVVAPQGTAFTTDHARILKRYVEEVVLCFDSDQAGQNAAVRALDTLMGVDLSMRVALIPEGHDPDSYIRRFGTDAFRQVIDEAQQFFDFYLNRLCHVHKTTSDRGRLTILREMAEAVQKTGNQVLADTYAQKTAQRLGVDPESVRFEFRKVHRRTPVPSATMSEEETEPQPILPAPSPQEAWLLKIIIAHEDLVPWVGEHLDPEWLRHEAIRSIIMRCLEMHERKIWKGVPALLDEIESEAYKRLITAAASESRAIPDPDKSLKGEGSRQGILELLRNEFVERKLKDLQLQATHLDLSQEAILEIESQKANLRRLKHEPLTRLQQT